MTQVFCDKCEKEIEGLWQKQEMYTLQIHGGYGSIFGDGSRYAVDLCQHCLYEMLDKAGLIKDQFFNDRNR